MSKRAGEILILRDVYKQIVKALHIKFCAENRLHQNLDTPPAWDKGIAFADYLEEEMNHQELKPLLTENLDDKISSRDFIYNRMRAYKNEMSEWKPFSVRKIRPFMLYLGFESISGFIDQHDYFQSQEGKELKKQQLEVWNDSRKINPDKKVTTYYTFSYHQIDVEIQFYTLEIDYAKKGYNTVLISNKDSKRFKGKATYRKTGLLIEFQRIDGIYWRPATIFFQIKSIDNISNLPVLIGTYTGASTKTRKAISGEMILCQKDICDNNPDVRLAIEQRVILGMREFTVTIDETAQYQGIPGINKLLHLPYVDEPMIKPLIGRYELFNIFSDRKQLLRANLEIRENYRCILKLSDTSYIGKIETERNSVFIYFWRLDKQDGSSYEPKGIDGCLVIKGTPDKVFNEDFKIYRGGFTGKTDLESTELFSVYLLKVTEWLPTGMFEPEEIPALISERKEYYPKLLSLMLNREQERWEGIKPFKDAI